MTIQTIQIDEQLICCLFGCGMREARRVLEARQVPERRAEVQGMADALLCERSGAPGSQLPVWLQTRAWRSTSPDTALRMVEVI